MKDLLLFESESIISDYQYPINLELPAFLYHTIYPCDILKMKSEGLKRDFAQKSYNNMIGNCLYLCSDSHKAVSMALESTKVSSSMKESIFIVKIKTEDLKKENMFIDYQSDNTEETIYLYQGDIPYSAIGMVYVFE